MNNISKKILLLAFFLTVSVNLYSQKDKSITIGIVDVATIATQLPESQEADKKLKDMQKVVTDSLMKMQESYQKRVEGYLKQKTMMPAAEQQKSEEAFRLEEQQILQFREAKLAELGQKRDEFLEPIRNKIKTAINEVAKEEGLKLVLDKTSSVVLFNDDNMDITFRVLDKIKRGKK